MEAKVTMLNGRYYSGAEVKVSGCSINRVGEASSFRGMRAGSSPRTMERQTK